MKYSIILILILNFSVFGQKISSHDISDIKSDVFNDSLYVLDHTFPKGDARRYIVSAESAKSKHPFTNKTRLTTALDIAEKTGVKMHFPSGYYGMDLILDNRQNLYLSFDDSEFNLIHITQEYDSLPKPKNIFIDGNIISYHRLGITEAENIKIDSVNIKSDILKNLRGVRSKGCHIYHGSTNISIGYLQIDDFGSGSNKYLHNDAALAIDGWNNNPKQVTIKKLYIKSSDRHGIYLTGSNHFIGEAVIDKYGVGGSDHMSQMQDALAGEEKKFKALWVNKAYNSRIGKLTINEKESEGHYSIHLDYSDVKRPVIIYKLNIINSPDAKILEEVNNGVLITDKKGIKE